MLTLHKGFNRAANGSGGYVGTGYVISNNQLSGFIRPARDERGRAHDLGLFKNYQIPRSIMAALNSTGKDCQTVLYCFRHYPGRNKPPIVHGWLLMDTDRVTPLARVGTNGTAKSWNVLEECTAAMIADGMRSNLLIASGSYRRAMEARASA